MCESVVFDFGFYVVFVDEFVYCESVFLFSFVLF